jgi:hypothetical protein
MGAPGMPMMAAPAPIAQKKYPLNKDEIKGGKLKGFTWKRVVLDLDGPNKETPGAGTKCIVKEP